MGRPSKYSSAREAAEANLYSKQGGLSLGLTLHEFIQLSTSRCHVCNQEPSQPLVVNRTDDKYVLHWNYLVDGKPTCAMCKELAKEYGIPIILRHCARIMAKRMHDKRRLCSK